jgi:hypothetical protein
VPIPVTMPLAEPIVPAAVLVLLQLPPVPVVESVVVLPMQTVLDPLIVPASGNGFTVNARVAVADPQPLVTVYVILITPAEIPVIFPPASIVPIALLLLDHVPPPVPLDENVTAPVTHIFATPLTDPASGSGFTDTITVAVLLQLPEVPSRVYVVVTVGLAVTVEPVVADRPVPGVQV